MLFLTTKVDYEEEYYCNRNIALRKSVDNMLRNHYCAQFALLFIIIVEVERVKITKIIKK